MSLGSSVRKSFHPTEHKHLKLSPKEAILASPSCQARLPRAQRLGSYTVTWIREFLMVNFNFGGRVNWANLSLDPFPSFDALQTDALLHCHKGRGRELRARQWVPAHIYVQFCSHLCHSYLFDLALFIYHLCLQVYSSTNHLVNLVTPRRKINRCKLSSHS